ncbi:hAT family dimerization protein [Rhizoctonia solani]|uniref:HAT family dimerization protein n=1 Tax=Rhizoctonia solani TaxID=456999 RepID=A0A8H8P2Q3_9AGAM|nr:hAT family dimerization protein [Rhizoctonia solani]QRW24601.1 hAT family dimerization protein [Rhizoctonia solani]
MTSRPAFKLSSYGMSQVQWDMLKECTECLEIFEEPTLIHSQKGIALIHEVIPHMLLMKHRLIRIRDAIHDAETEQPPQLVACVAAVAAIQVIDKYLKLLEGADIYWLAIVLCPWYKMQWLEEHGYPSFLIERVRRVLFDRFASYSVRFGSQQESTRAAAPTQMANLPRRRFMHVPSSSSRTDSPYTTISAPLSVYLSSSPVSEAEVLQVGGLIQYWDNVSRTVNGSILGRMALDILSAPSSSVDVERAFSGGRMALNYRQHRTSVATFRAKMAVRSWYGTPLLPEAQDVYEMIEGRGATEPEPLD